MTPAQQDTIDRLAVDHGRVCVRDGYADGLVRVTAPDGGHWHVDEDGVPTQKLGNFSVDWSYS